jgi:nucleotide-binding universal stress UspA family protein
MQNMLIPVDFSAASAQALRYAYRLNAHFISKFQILHLFDVPITVGDDADLYLKNYEAYRRSFDEELWEFVARNKGDYHYDTEVFTTSGGHYQGIVDFARHHHPDLIVIGNRGAGAIRKWMFGSVARYLLTHPPIPVIGVPEDFTIGEIHQVLLATDLTSLIPDSSVAFLKKFLERIGAKLLAIHAREKGELSLPMEKNALDQIRQAFGAEPEIRTLKPHQHISQCIDECISENGADLLVTMPHAHTWLDRMLIGSETSELASMVKIPVMSLPAK